MTFLLLATLAMAAIVSLLQSQQSYAFSPILRSNSHYFSSPSVEFSRKAFDLYMTDNTENDGVVELADDEVETKEEESSAAAPFLSQGEILEESLNPDLSDPKQTRVIIYIIISLIPVLFLVPLMLGSRDLIPLDSLPPVDL